MKKLESKLESLSEFKLSIKSSEQVFGGAEDTETCTEVCASRGDCTGDGVDIPSSVEFDSCGDA
jgi:hypothetical protein